MSSANRTNDHWHPAEKIWHVSGSHLVQFLMNSHKKNKIKQEVVMSQIAIKIHI